MGLWGIESSPRCLHEANLDRPLYSLSSLLWPQHKTDPHGIDHSASSWIRRAETGVDVTQVRSLCFGRLLCHSSLPMLTLEHWLGSPDHDEIPNMQGKSKIKTWLKYFGIFVLWIICDTHKNALVIILLFSFAYEQWCRFVALVLLLSWLTMFSNLGFLEVLLREIQRMKLFVESQWMWVSLVV